MPRLRSIIGILLLVAGSTGIAAAGTNGDSVFLVAPMAGTVESDVQYASPAGEKELKDRGPLYAVHMLYADPRICIGCMGHFSQLDKSYENGSLIYAQYYAGRAGALQPAFGFNLDYVHIYTQLPRADIAPLTSLDVDTSLWGLHPTVGVSYAAKNMRVTPFAGCFEERVNTVVTSAGMRIGGQTRNGFKSTAAVVEDYASLGSKFEWTIAHFVKLDLKAYYRLKQGERPLFTTRNRIDFYLSRNTGISVKLDYFDDKYEKNMFAFVGPVFVF